jgi:P27 family predicted phage terminase small subunit
MPPGMPAAARAEWRRVVPALVEMGVLARMDRSLLLRYCLAWADWCELTELLRTSGKLLRGQKGNLVRNPLWMMKRDAEQIVTDLARQLGLTPAARLRAGVRHERPQDEDEARAAKLAVIADYRRALGVGAEGQAKERGST